MMRQPLDPKWASPRRNSLPPDGGSRHRAGPGDRPPSRRRMYAGLVALALAALVVFGGTYSAVSLVPDLFQPAGPASAPPQRVVVRAGESTAAIASDLQQQGLIRNAFLFRMVAKAEGLDRGLKAGVYQISPSLSMTQIITTLQHAIPSQVPITIPEGLRVSEYPAYLTGLPNFDAQQFLQIARTGQFPGRERYWYVQPPAGARYALEGFLFPSTYEVDPRSTAVDVVKTMLDGLGLALCPGPAQDQYRYIYDQQQCRAHPRIVDAKSHLNVFDALSQRHLTFAQALALASIVQREARSASAKAGVASVYYNRYLAAAGIQPGPDNGGPITLDADPTVQYAVGTAQTPWPALQAQARTVAPNDAFNTYTHVGLPPSPICGSGLDVILDVIAAPRTDYYYFITGADHRMHFAHTYAQQQQNIGTYGIG